MAKEPDNKLDNEDEATRGPEEDAVKTAFRPGFVVAKPVDLNDVGGNATGDVQHA